ncbi:hypothetical protein BLBBOR_573 [Blattabacterium sp. (Blatta orientalis) str. Tarazona]|uniref:hypothetical protein n=1 Tax=Blattabacterium sp. (Blatta orientalis) TaxID=367806 RepID=UPI0002AD808F|nr:hypothetical protein [Blattabacterium sp. (Blatta orientalis)]AGD98445.1 hypothetical protein BLBBOR_573 [Blattabacterium sp. (Blatta orientalis) str. Tarazona]
MYQFSQENKKIIIFIMFIGFFFFFLIKFFFQRKFFSQKKELFLERKSTENEKNALQKSEKIENQPWIGLYMSLFYFTSISLGSLFFLGIQYVSKSGWSIIIHPIMEEVSSFLPYGGVMILIILLLNAMDYIHIFHWMDPTLYDPTSLEYDKVIASKKLFLNIPFFLIRSFIYIIGWCFFIQNKKTSSILDKTCSLKDYKKLNFLSLIFIIFFSITSIFMGWDWIMSLNPHWFSTLFSWYVLSTYIVTGISTITIIAIYLKKKGCLPFFNENHLHDLSKYLFSTSLLWTYLWFSQFVLYWYGNIPEEISFFLKREEVYGSIHFWMLISNFLIPFLGLMSSRCKTNPRIVFIIASILLFGHYIDIYNLIAPDVNGIFDPKFGLSEIGSFLLIGSIFSYILFRNLNKKNFILLETLFSRK